MDELAKKFAEIVCQIADVLGIGSMYCVACKMGMPAHCINFGYKAAGILSLIFFGFYVLERITDRR
jgi:hypothetical protein